MRGQRGNMNMDVTRGVAKGGGGGGAGGAGIGTINQLSAK